MAKKAGKNAKSENENTVAVLSYLLVGIIWYFVDEDVKKSQFAKFHVKQALNLLVIWVAVSIAMNIIMIVLFFLGPQLLLISSGVGILLFVLWLIGIINAAQKKKQEIPLVGKFADRYLNF